MSTSQISANDSLYFNLIKANRANVPFNIFIGGRGTGKTYRCLWHAYEDYDCFMYLRRTEVEIGAIADEKYNPFKALNRDKGWNIQANYVSKNSVGEFFVEDEDEVTHFLGYAAALSTFGNLRGADLSDVDVLVFDEFIKGKNKRPIADEADAFFNTYETINRNREIEGKPPLQCYLLSNATTMDSPILAELGLISVIEKMKQKGDLAWTDKQRGIHIELVEDLPISKLKQDTALYRLTRGTQYSKHAIDNEFAYDSFENVGKVDIRNYEGLIQVGDVYIYKHKTTSKLHACGSKALCKYKYDGDSIPLFKRQWGIRIYALMRNGTMTYSDFMTKNKLFTMFDNK